eukprot:7033812-Lingulodinium_polyedra.AAC.1
MKTQRKQANANKNKQATSKPQQEKQDNTENTARNTCLSPLPSPLLLCCPPCPEEESEAFLKARGIEPGSTAHVELTLSQCKSMLYRVQGSMICGGQRQDIAISFAGDMCRHSEQAARGEWSKEDLVA